MRNTSENKFCCGLRKSGLKSILRKLEIMPWPRCIHSLKNLRSSTTGGVIGSGPRHQKANFYRIFWRMSRGGSLTSKKKKRQNGTFSIGQGSILNTSISTLENLNIYCLRPQKRKRPKDQNWSLVAVVSHSSPISRQSPQKLQNLNNPPNLLNMTLFKNPSVNHGTPSQETGRSLCSQPDFLVSKKWVGSSQQLTI